ncbi:MAG: hypothetical protein WAR83_14125 [Flavobacteriales bacterium]
MSTTSNTNSGTRFITDRTNLLPKVAKLKAVIFDWDGVFNDGFKDKDGGSPFSEVGSMGVNLVRFALWLKNGEMPKAAVITGKQNHYAENFAQRERMHGVYMGFSNKPDAFNVFLAEHGLKAEEIAFVFDDVLDLSLAAICGVRIMIGSSPTAWLVHQVIARGEVDVVTGNNGGENGLREATDLLIDLLGNGKAVLDNRVGFTAEYQQYLAERQALVPKVVKHQGQ